jgi:hypothetical protein
MALRTIFVLSAAITVSGVLPSPHAAAGDCMFGCWSRPACGKVCQLVCDTKKLQATCFGCECKDICIPGPSRPGCKCWTCCCGDCECGPDGGPCCHTCQAQPPLCKFCWRDWIACGCARPRTVKVLTKYQAEKEIDWYHWEVVDAACCGCASCCGAVENNVETRATENAATQRVAPSESPARIPATPIGIANSTDGRVCIYKPAPPGSQIGDAFAVDDDERSQLARWMGTQLDKDSPLPAANDPQIECHARQPIGAVRPAAAMEPADDSAWNSFSRLFRLND